MSDLAQGNPYAPPRDGGARFAPQDQPLDLADLDHQLAELRPKAAVKAAIGMMAASGALLILAALQLWDTVLLLGVVRFVPLGMLLLGAASLTLSVKIYRQRVWAAVTALIVAGVTALGMGTWFLLAAGSGFISLIGLLVPLCAALAAVFAGLAIGACRRTATLRRRFSASGLDVDF
jgi:hypothetical protein